VPDEFAVVAPLELTDDDTGEEFVVAAAGAVVPLAPDTAADVVTAGGGQNC
jgi:hypothetical protein